MSMKQEIKDVHPNWKRKVTHGGWEKDDRNILDIWQGAPSKPLHACTCPMDWHPPTRPYCPVHNPLREEPPRPQRRANLHRIAAIRKEDV